MKEHPIPQDITNYRFHIVGSMTLKQFGEVLVGVIISFAIYQTNLIAIIKWPLIILFFGGGLLAAFVPIEERPLSHWMSTFFGIIYKPTQFFWKRTQQIPEPFLYKGDKEKITHVQEIDLTPARRKRIKEFLNSTKAITPDPEDFTVFEQQQLTSVMNLFESGPQAASIFNPVNVQKPDLTIRVRTLRSVDDEQAPTENQTLPENEPAAVSYEKPSPITPLLPPPVISVDTQNTDKKDVYLQAEQVAQNIEIPEEKSVSVARPQTADTEDAMEKLKPHVLEKQVFIADQTTPTTATEPAAAATFNSALPFPDKPTEPNKLVGMILTATNEIVPNAIVEISTSQGHVARAVKTNALGQFFITTPLKSDTYVVAVQKEGLSFDPIQIVLNNSIVEPLEIRSK